jgi:hypothetical protein
VNPWSSKDWKPLAKRSAEEYVTRKQGERNSLDAVFPLVCGGVEGQESLKPLPRQDLMNALLVLMAGIEGIPDMSGVQVSQGNLSFDARFGGILTPPNSRRLLSPTSRNGQVPTSALIY